MYGYLSKSAFTDLYSIYIYISSHILEDPEAGKNASNTRVKNFRLRSEFLSLKNEKLLQWGKNVSGSFWNVWVATTVV